ncbi:MAG: PAS domain S-box protein [Dehalococcoidales bacterium]|nr:MAG: PAS domain S-box protein [Dehalococcoidales bacterium]
MKQTLRQTLKVPHLWIILAIMAFGSIVYYADQIPILDDIVSQAPIQLARYSTHRILSIIPVAYAAFIFRFRGGAIIATVVSLGLLPRALFISSQRPEALAETVAFFAMGVFVSWLIDRQQQSLRRLENTQLELMASLKTVQDQQYQLQLSEERYRGLFENAGEAIFVCSTDGEITSANNACELLTGYDYDSLIATTIYELFSGEGKETVRRIFSEGLGGRTISGTDELSLARKDGSEAFIRLAVSPLPSGNQTIALQAIATDVTEERRLRSNMEYYITQITRAQEDERLRISRELHDDTAQVLAGLSRDIASLTTDESILPQNVVEDLKTLRETANSMLEGVRRFSQDLRPSILDDLGLVPALEWLLDNIEKQHDIKTGISITGNQRRPVPEKELIIFRVAQEALSNVRRHSNASTVEMSIDIDEAALTLIISDNGRGFDIPQRASDLVQSGKLGIVGMRERARLVGGTLIVQSESGKGTTVTLRVPE